MGWWYCIIQCCLTPRPPLPQVGEGENSRLWPPLPSWERGWGVRGSSELIMAAEKAVGIVVRTTDWSETSRIATVWTREFGKVRVLAKGGRRLKSNFEVALDLLSVCSIVLLRKSSGLDLLTEARAEERFGGLRSNLRALYAGYYIAELLG